MKEWQIKFLDDMLKGLAAAIAARFEIPYNDAIECIADRALTVWEETGARPTETK